MTLPADHDTRIRRVEIALDGLSVGDAFGESFFGSVSDARRRIEARLVPAPPWRYTDDTEMALGIAEELRDRGQIDRAGLAQVFGYRYSRHPDRGYGGGAHEILRAIAAGEDWAAASARSFGGTGSMGNGAAMRVAPIGAYFANDLQRVIENARASAEVTHAHPEAQAGAIAVAVAAAYAASVSDPNSAALLDAVLRHTPESETRNGVREALSLPADSTVSTVAQILGNGTRVLAQDTVPFALWCAAHHLPNYVEALWATAFGLGDVDTTCAIVGGIVALASPATIPATWIRAREALEWF